MCRESNLQLPHLFPPFQRASIDSRFIHILAYRFVLLLVLRLEGVVQMLFTVFPTGAENSER